MNFTAKKSDLQRALALCAGVVERRNTIPILANIKLAKSGKNLLSLTASDMDMELTVTIEAQHGKGGAEAVTLPCHTFSDVVKKSGADEIGVAAKDGKVGITAGKAKFSLGTLPAEDYPAFKEADAGAEFSLNAEALLGLIDAVRHAMSSEETRYYLNGIFFENRAGKLRAVATDGCRLAMAEAAAGEDLPDFAGVILPRKAVGELRKMIDGLSGAVAVTLSPGRAVFDLSGHGLVFSTKLVADTFPDYERIMPRDNPLAVEVNTAQLQQAIARVTAVAEGKSHAVKMVFGKGGITLSCAHDGNSAEDVVEADWDHPPLTIGFNAAYLADALARMPVTCTIAMSNPAAPAVITADGATGGGLHVIMPMRV